MAWDRNDWLTVAFVAALMIIGLIVAAMLLGVMPDVNGFFEFKKPEPTPTAQMIQRFLFRFL